MKVEIEKKTDKKEEEEIKKLLEDQLVYQRVFGTKEGRRVLKDLMENCNFFGTTFDENPYSMYFKEGERSVVARILDSMRLDPEKLRKEMESPDFLESNDLFKR